MSTFALHRAPEMGDLPFFKTEDGDQDLIMRLSNEEFELLGQPVIVNVTIEREA